MSGKGKSSHRGAPLLLPIVIFLCLCALAIHNLSTGLTFTNDQAVSHISERGELTDILPGDCEECLVFACIAPWKNEVLVAYPHSLIPAVVFSYSISPLLPPPNL